MLIKYSMKLKHGGDLVAKVLQTNDVKYLFTLSGGHISPILVGAKEAGIRIIDTRDEASTVFAADVVFRLTGVPGIAVVTAGPGVTNTLTVIKNAQLAESAVILMGGAAATLLRGRGALQDVDALSVVKSMVKWSKSISKVRDIVPTLTKAFELAQSGVPGPVFIELPIDLLYPENLVREMYGIKEGRSKTFMARFMQWYLRRQAASVFGGAFDDVNISKFIRPTTISSDTMVQKVKDAISTAERPVLLISSQATMDAMDIDALRAAVERLNIPVFLSGMARGLLGKNHPLHMRHKRTLALRNADLVILAGVATDFRLDYGRQINKRALLISINLCKETLNKNKLLRKIDMKIKSDAGRFIKDLANTGISVDCKDWYNELRARHDARDEEILAKAGDTGKLVNPIRLCVELDNLIDEDSLIIGDGGDFIATVSYIVQPRRPLRWLDPGVFGTLGTGGGFAMASKLLHPDTEVWLMYGDGSSAYTIAEFDTYVRHNLPVIAIIGNDASWQQIARGQIDMLDDDIATVLEYTDYHVVAEGYGATGILVRTNDEIVPAIKRAKELAKQGKPVLINVLLDKTDFRKGSLSV